MSPAPQRPTLIEFDFHFLQWVGKPMIQLSLNRPLLYCRRDLGNCRESRRWGKKGSCTFTKWLWSPNYLPPPCNMIVMRHRQGSSFTSFQQEHQHHHLKFHSRFGLTHRASSRCRCRCMTIIFRFSAWKLPLCCRRQRQYLLLLLHHHLCMPLLKHLKRLTIMMMLILLFIYKFNNRILFSPFST